VPAGPQFSPSRDATWWELRAKGYGSEMSMGEARGDRLLTLAWVASLGLALGVRGWNALGGPLFYGYDAWAHVSYVFFLDLYHSIPYADQGWSYFHPPLHYLFGWLLAQAGSGEVLVRGLSVLGSAASFGVALMAAHVVRVGIPGRPLLPLISFTAVAFLPLHLYSSPMPGNELTATFLSAAIVVLCLRNELRHRPRPAGDIATGVVAGLGMLTKFSVALPLAVACAIPTLRWLGAALTRGKEGSERRRIDGEGAPRRVVAGFAQLAARLALILGPVLLISGSFYARSIAEYGTPFQLARDFPPMADIEASQPPGARFLGDYFRVSPELFENANWQAPHMLHAVWPNVHLNTWFDTYREGQLPFNRIPAHNPEFQKLTILMGCLGLLPTLLALFGAVVSAHRLLRSPASLVDATMLLLAVLSMTAFVLFTWRVPTFAALKASYLLNLSLPFGFFIARALEAFTKRGHAWAFEASALYVGAVAMIAAAVFTTGGLLRMRDPSDQMAAVWTLFSEYQPARALYLGRLHPGASRPQIVEPLAAVELLDGRIARARSLYRRCLPGSPAQYPFAANRLAVATTLDGDLEAARKILDEALQGAEHSELLVNRGALLLAAGSLDPAETDLRRALEIDPDLTPAWINLAAVLERQNRAEPAADARRQARAAEARPPRGFPYGIGNGNLFESGSGQRWMLALRDEELALYLPPRSRLRSRFRY